MAHIASNNKRLISRVRRIQGQLASIEKMLVSEVDCMAILQQVAAIKGAASSLTREVLEEHLREHLGAADIDQKHREEEVEEVILVLRSYLK
ncbi:MAG: metal/formaldehyde-sensitive transcriptional repressor [Kordiimonadaceae bacterium]|nr:metal/formaldehyde-sensitive transcriptional repressor [Kordiimonadaceae bacterium]